MSTCELNISTDPANPIVTVGGRDVSDLIRGPQVTAAVSALAADPAVRAIAVAQQRAIIEASRAGIVVEGRDITTVVAPDADVRVFLTADEVTRGARRAAEFADPVLAEEMRTTVAARDVVDSSRQHSPLRQAEGVTVIDATHRTLPQVIDEVLALVEHHRGGGHA